MGRAMTDAHALASAAPLRLFNSLTRSVEDFTPVHPGEARVYSCGPTVYNFQHIGNMRAYVFADTLGRTLAFKGYKLRHIINITDVGHLTSDADAGDDKMEKAAALQGKSAWDIAAFYTAEFKRDLQWLNVRDPAKWTVATDYVARMIEFAKSIAYKHCYELESGLYFDVSTVADYGRLARAVTDEGEGRIEEVDGKRHAADFAIWRKTPAGETRQMEWDSPWVAARPAGISNARSWAKPNSACRSTSTPAASTIAKSTILTRSRKIRRSAVAAGSTTPSIRARACGCIIIF